MDTIKDLTFDNIYHEHYNYWSLTSFTNFFNKLDAKIFKSERINTHGGSIRVFIKDKKVKIDKSVKKMLRQKINLELKNMKLTKNLVKKFIKYRKCLTKYKKT